MPAAPDGAARYSLDAWSSIASNSTVLRALRNTIELTIAHQLISLPIAILVSWLISRTDLPGRDWLEFGFWISFFLPPLSIVQSWILLLDPQYGLINKALVHVLPISSGPFDIYTWWGIVFAHLATSTISAKVMLMTPAFRNMDSSLEEVSRTLGDSGLRTLLKIVLPIMAPVVLVTTVMGLIRALEAFEIELVLGSPQRIYVYSTLIYEMVRSDPPNYAGASALGILIMALMAMLALIPVILTRRKNYTTLSGRGVYSQFRLRRWKWPAFAFVFGTVMFLTVIPVFFLGINSVMHLFGFFDLEHAFTTSHWQAVLKDVTFRDSLVNTLVLAAGTAAFALVASFILAYIVVRSKFWGRHVLDFLSWVPFTMPGVLFSLAVLWLALEIPFLRPLYGTTVLMVLTVGIGMLTVGTQIIKSNLLQLGSDLERASWISGASWAYTLMRITIALSIRALIVVGIMGFISASRNISHIALLASSDNRPLALLQFEYMMEGRYEAASVIGFIVIVVTTGVAFLARTYGLRLGPSHAG
jgi:iron(III) transport system permease protein